MTSKKIDSQRRKFLTGMTGVLASVGAVFAALPFIKFMTPSRAVRISAGPLEVDLSQIAIGEQKTVLWQGKPIWIIRRTVEQLAQLKKDNINLRDPLSLEDQQPSYARNLIRARESRPDILVLVGVCTHLGCAPTYRPDKKSIDASWEGGFFCSCHGSMFDLSGRVFQNVPAPLNLVVPPYAYKDNDTLIIGVSDASEVSV